MLINKKEKIVVKIEGGLGNQMFQYAFGMSIALKYNAILVLDISYYNNNECHNGFELSDVFLLDSKVSVRKKFQGGFLASNRYLVKVIDFIGIRKYLLPCHFFEQLYRFNDILSPECANNYYTGFWQNELYFSDIRNKILDDFSFKRSLSVKNMELLNKVKNSNSVAIQVRRGDYVSNKSTNEFHGTCEVNYFYDAIEVIKKENSNIEIYIFSDDIDWAKNNIFFNSISYFINLNKGNEAYLDMLLMSNCKHVVISNSSFGWWAAWINKNPFGVVVAPKRWFNSLTIDTSDLCPKTWHRV
jgi:hypothetical protein